MSIDSKALLVQLSISQWGNRAIDKRVTAEVGAKYDAVTREDRYIQTLVPRKAVLEIQRCASDLRDFHYHNTLPWQDNNTRILASANYFRYQQEFTQLRNNFEDAVAAFLAHYPDWVDTAKLAKKELFDASQYPSVEELRTRYGVSISFLPFPNVADFRVDLTPNELAEIQATATDSMDKALAAANQSLIKRLIERIDVLYTALRRELSSPFRESTVTSIAETADIVLQLNVTDNQIVRDAARMCRQIMAGITGRALRTDSHFRTSKCNELAQTLHQLKAYHGYLGSS